jgi:hypothetical protein
VQSCRFYRRRSLSSALSISTARGAPGTTRRDGGRAAHASVTFDVFASAAPARSVTRVTHRRPIEGPGPRPLAGFCQPAIKYCHGN